VGSSYEWECEANNVLLAAEKAEAELSYSSDCISEDLRKVSGSYYTPADVADHFWAIFFERRKLSTPEEVRHFVSGCVFVEPSVGAGALFFSLLKAIIRRGLNPTDLSLVKADLIDINEQALQFIRQQIDRLERLWNIKFLGIRLIHQDFRNYQMNNQSSFSVFFGNPPFVANERGASDWKNLYADFLELSLRIGGCSSHLHFILPLSITFSRDYAALREQLLAANLKISISSYDNIPDTLFKSGKPKHTNTNKANSQRCSILSAVPSNSPSLSSSQLHRWAKSERADLMASIPVFMDMSGYNLDDQFPRPTDSFIAEYLLVDAETKRLSKFTSKSDLYQLFVAPVARNYIGFREQDANGCNILCFSTEEAFLTTLGILSSRLFFNYWLSIGDGFHVTKSNVLNFPVTKIVEEKVWALHPDIQHYWKNRKRFEKVKLNNGRYARSFDFSSIAPRLIS